MLRRFAQQEVLYFLKSRNLFATSKAKKVAVKPDAPPAYNIAQALRLTRAHAMASFDETIEICIKLDVNPKHGDQVVRGTCTMPFGLGKTATVGVFTTKEMAEKAKAAGADVIIDEKVLEDVKNGIIKFEKCLATPEVIADLKPFAKILGPKGLMPNQKIGTLVTVEKLEQAIKETKMGSVTFRVDQGACIQAPLGKVSFTEERIKGNLKSLMQALIDKRPPAIKGGYILSAVMSSTMGPGWYVNIDSIDPRAKNCLL